MKKSTLFGILFVFLAVANCDAVGSIFDQPTLKVVKAKVTLNIFSGRPNPTWALSSKDANQLLSKINELPKSNSTSSLDGLGYNGFQVELTHSASPKSKIISDKGLVIYSNNGTNYYFSDSQRLVEKFLLKSGKSTLDSQLYQTVKAEIETNGN